MRPMSCCRRGLSAAFVALAIAAVAPAAAGAAPSSTAPGAPGAKAFWTPADKQGFGTSMTTQSKVWHTLQGGELTEVYYPDLSTPALRDLQLIVTDGRTFTDRETDATTQHVELVDKHSLTYRQVNTAKSGRYRIVKTYVTDPSRNTLLVDVRFQSLTGRPYQVYAYVDPSLSNDGSDDSGTTSHGALLTQDADAGQRARRRRRPSAAPRPATWTPATAGSTCATTTGWTGSTAPRRPATSSRPPQTKLDGRRHQHLQLALGFADTSAAALGTARASLQRGFGRVAGAYADSWHRYLGSLKRQPASARPYGAEYDESVMVLAAHEDKTYRGAFIASPTMPWAWGTGFEFPKSGVYHAVWSRDLYQIVTGMMAAGDRGAAERALSFVFDKQQRPDGSIRQNTFVDGTPHWDGTQQDEVAFPIVLAWQLRPRRRADLRPARQAGGRLARPDRPADPTWTAGRTRTAGRRARSPRRSPGSSAPPTSRARRATTRARPPTRQTADEWQKSVESWTATTNGPYSDKPYYLRVTKDANPNDGSTYSIGDSGPSAADERTVVDPSFLELVRLGVKKPDDPTILNSIARRRPAARRRHPERALLAPRQLRRLRRDSQRRAVGLVPAGQPDATHGRAWPIFAGERGEYNLTAGGTATAQLAAMAGAANEGGLIPEQVWDDQPPSGTPGFPKGEGTLSATPLAWSHAQFVRLAWSIEAGGPVEQPSIVACRYVRTC